MTLIQIQKPQWKLSTEVTDFIYFLVIMKDIAIYGAGGFGREVACLIKKINEVKPTWNLIGFFDDAPEKKGHMVSHFGLCLGGINELNTWEKALDVVISIASPIMVRTVFEKITNVKISFPNMIHPSVSFCDPETFLIGRGNIVQSDCIFSCDVSIGDFNMFNGTVVLGHDAKVGNFNTFMPAIRVSGDVTIENGNFFGVGSIILQRIKIGNQIRLGAGSVLMTKPKDGMLYIGNPARITNL